MLLASGGWFEFGQPLTAKELVRSAGDRFDRRPSRRLLILGNSRTYYHDMPDMVREMADSAGDGQRYDITVDAQPGASLETLWSDQRVRDLLGEHWDDVVVQGESRAEATEAQAQSFQSFGRRLLGAARQASTTSWLVVNWNYDAQLWGDSDPTGEGREAYFESVQSASGSVADATGARLLNIGRLWGRVASEHREIAVTEDGNHPTLAGSYLFALLIYADLSQRDPGLVTYVPAGLDAKTATVLHQAVSNYGSG